MARLPRVVIVDVPHHVTQRGNARQVIFAQDADRIVYLELLRQYSELCRLSLLGYSLMSNHVHLIAVPGTAEALASSTLTDATHRIGTRASRPRGTCGRGDFTLAHSTIRIAGRRFVMLS